MNYDDEVNKLISQKVYNIKEKVVEINDNVPIFNKQDYETPEGKPIYFEFDELNRSTGAIALISLNTIPLVTKKKLDYPDPNGWDKNFEGKKVFERCHIIAYNLSAKLADKRNLFIGTKFLNSSSMKKIENKVNKYIKNNNVHVLYRVTIKYKKDDIIPKGVLIEAKSLEDDFSVCKFCYNVQENVKFNYSNGKIISDNRISTKIRKILKINTKETKKKTKKSVKSKNPKDVVTDYIINRKTKEFHTYKANCNKIEKVDSKYIQEATISYNELIKSNLKPCTKCISFK